MSRIDLLRMKRAAASYGHPLTILERLELARLEAELDDQRLGRATDTAAPYVSPIVRLQPPVTVVYES